MITVFLSNDMSSPTTLLSDNILVPEANTTVALLFNANLTLNFVSHVGVTCRAEVFDSTWKKIGYRNYTRSREDQPEPTVSITDTLKTTFSTAGDHPVRLSCSASGSQDQVKALQRGMTVILAKQ